MNYTPFDQELYKSSASRFAIPCLCRNCTTVFKRSKQKIKDDRDGKVKPNLFCSTKCSSEYKSEKQSFLCSQCNIVETKRKPSEIAKSKTGRFFCSRSCSVTYNNLHKTHGNRRSKMEIVLEDFIRDSYPALNLICNDKTAIGSELDFYFPELNFAIELNGIFHYEPIYGQDKLDKIQNNDNRKIIACYEQGIELAIIDSSSCKSVTKNQQHKYESIVDSIIVTVLSNRN